MGRRNIIPSDRLELKLPEDLMNRITLHLYSPLEGRVPKGAYKAFFESLAREFFANLESSLCSPPNSKQN